MHDGSFSYVWRKMFHIGGFSFYVEEGNMTQYGVRSSASCFLMPLFVWKGSSQTRTDFLLAPSVMWTSWRQCDMEWKVTSVGGSIRFRLLISPCRFNAWWLCVEYWPAGINHQSPFPYFYFLFSKIGSAMEFVPCFSGQVDLILFLGGGGRWFLVFF